jgi:hypothetical protein
MGETTRQIATHIEHTREDLGSNLQELEHKVRSVTDWRHQFQSNPMLMVGLAFGTGLCAATLAGGRDRLAGMSSNGSSTRPGVPPRGATREKQQLLDTWANIKGALVGVATSQVKSFLGASIPGFDDALSNCEKEKSQSVQNRNASSMSPSSTLST